MRTYVWLAQRLPGLSLTMKITLVSLVIVHVPLLAVVAVSVAAPGLGAVAISGTALGATMLATLAMVAVLRGLLAPLQLAGDQLADYLAHRRLPSQAQVGNDEAGQLLHDVALACARIEHQRAVLERLSLEDPLTGIHNRRGGEAQLAQLRASRHDHRPLSVAVVDLDNLRQLNADAGHTRGDQGLRQVATELEAVLRGDDWVARWGGDEFLVLCHCPGEDMVTLMNRARQQLARFHGDRRAADFAISVGVAELQPAESLDDCIIRADTALYAAKTHGRDNVRAAS